VRELSLASTVEVFSPDLILSRALPPVFFRFHVTGERGERARVGRVGGRCPVRIRVRQSENVRERERERKRERERERERERLNERDEE
jgi:hypothetical protein